MRYWEPVNDSDLDRIHEAACQILDELGIRIRDPESLEVLEKAGARRSADDTVLLPRDLIERAIESAPETFTVFDRQGHAMVVGDEAHYHLAGGTMTEILEYPGWSRRPAALKDVRDLTRIIDALDCVEFGIPMVEGLDAPPGAGEILAGAEVLKNTSKFCLACPVDRRANRAWVDMAKAAAGTDDLSGRPIIGMLATMVPGYEIDAEGAQALLIAAQEGVPIVLMGSSISGAQGPATMAGGMVMKLAEELAGLCLVQSIRPGSPCLMSWGLVKLDMRTADIEEAGPEYPLSMGVGAQLSRRYGIPSYACPAADSKIADFQGGIEMGACMQTAFLSGIHVTVNAGTAAKCSVASYELLVLHNEMLRNMGRVRRGLKVRDETLAVEVQKEVGIRGDYLVHPHTLQFVRDPEEFLHKDLFDATGVKQDYEDTCLRAKARWQEILRDHQPAVGEEECRAIDAVAAAYIDPS